VLAIAGQIQSDLIGMGRGVLHEINDQLGTIASVCKQVERAMTPEEIPGMVHRAMRALQTGRPRPVEIEVPPDVLERVGDVTLQEPEVFARRADPTSSSGRRCAGAERPLIGQAAACSAAAEARALASILERRCDVGERSARQRSRPSCVLGWGGDAAARADVALAEAALRAAASTPPRPQADVVNSTSTAPRWGATANHIGIEVTRRGLEELAARVRHTARLP
jgi:acetolactate synthase-1/2/3 large subunit